MSGIELCRRVRETSNVPIIVMSGSAECASKSRPSIRARTTIW